MASLVVAVAALVVSALTLFSGFGLGTLLMPVFSLFFPLEVAVAATAVVHGLNNALKYLLVGRRAHGPTLLRFALPAVVSALLGAWVLSGLTRTEPLLRYTLLGREAAITPLKLVMAGLMVVFALFDLVPSLKSLRFEARYLPLGGVLSGFFGGLSGHQGALRSAFLVKTGLSTEQFVGTNAATAALVDAARLLVYGGLFSTGTRLPDEAWPLVTVATAAAFAGVIVGQQLLPKVTMGTVQSLTGGLLVVIALALGAGLL